MPVEYRPGGILMTLAVLIMAGGCGTRLWPISRVGRAKQFSPLIGESSLLELTFDRVRRSLPDAPIFVNVTAGNEGWVHRLLPSLPRERIVAAPDDRDTLPSIGYATLAIERVVQDPTLLLVASDNWLEGTNQLREAFMEAIDGARRGPHLVSIGIRPSAPSTQYGYMHLGARAPFGASTYYGLGYLEKPEIEVAKRLLVGGQHDWNSGMFAWTAKTFWAALQASAPDAAGIFDRLRNRGDASKDEERALFGQLRKQGVDRGVLEKIGPGAAQKHLFVRAHVAWDDVGHYASLAPFLAEDGMGNRVAGIVRATRTHGCTIVSDDQALVELANLNDTIVVWHSGDLLVAARDSYGRVRDIVNCDLWPGVGMAIGHGKPEEQNTFSGFVKAIGARRCVVNSGIDGVIALLDVEDLDILAEPDHVVVRRRPHTESTTRMRTIQDRARVSAPARTRSVRLTVSEDSDRMSDLAARHVVKALEPLVRQGERAPLVMFSAGRTPLGLFRLLRTTYRNSLDWSRIRVAQMDEYVGVQAHDSLAASLRNELIEPLGIEQFFAIDESFEGDGMIAYEDFLGAEGLDLVIHGVGTNGHLGFNEPGSDFDGRGGIVPLAASTRARAPRLSFGEGVGPTHGLTVGLKVLTAASEVILLATGSEKTHAVKAALFACPNANVPASSLQSHPKVTIYTDRFAACSWLRGNTH